MNKVEILREYIDEILLDIKDLEERRSTYLHIYDFTESCASIALKYGENVELAVMAGMLHDISTYGKMDSKDHAYKSAVMAKEILTSLNITNEEETTIICSAISTHSDRESKLSGLNKVLIETVLFQDSLFNSVLGKKEDEKEIYNKLKSEFGII